MRFLTIFLCLALCVSIEARYTTLDDALLNGTKRVDVILYGKYTNSSGGYVNGSVGLGYITGFYYSLRAAISFRAAQSFFSSQNAFRRDFGGSEGTFIGDSAILLGESFLEYFDGDTAIKLGRFQPINEYINTLTDGIWIRNASLKNLTIEGMWAYRKGRVSYYEMLPFARLGNAGWFDVGIKYFFAGNRKDIKSSMYASVFSTFIPGAFVSLGTRWHSGFRFNGSETWFGIDIGFAGSFEDHQSNFSADNNTFLFDAKFSFGFSWLDIMVGYLASGRGGMGGLNAMGVGNGTQADDSFFYNNIQPFFIWGGHAIKFGRNAHLIYVASKLSFFDNKLNVYAAYGATFFDGYSGRYGSNNTTNIIQNELDIMAEFGITRTLSAIAFISDTHLGRDVPNIFQINGGFRFMF
ncbi:hypothetical protein [Helicobacter sp. MIT 14-3879]|uniref:hypothetical protein n=1 Tax=Helicobacter sp. MIT 14-3879 TaxID=2040649 RepID=UPI000E1E8141|nr:hypothetical protein [Helicobacter sp. MIT 14-3879]RDU61229.1 hypothetical protein CQA44_09670 [Helicobacter sp. MIT 14-3879]